ncbi:MAG: acyltransferase [Eubacteriales bacterium]|nr:acyltransferase [Eubacteriales bacterium]
MRSEKLEYLDGLKGIGCVAVFLTHFVYAFYYGMYRYDPASCHLPGGLDIAVGKSPLNVFFNGNTAVRLFLVLSGYLLCRGFFLTGDKRRLGRSAARRYLRLMPPVLAVNLLIWLCMTLGLYQNGAAAELAGSQEWFAGFNAFAPSFAKMLKESLYGCFLFGTNDYNGVLWTLQMLFLGAYLDYGMAALFGGKRWRWIVYAAAAALLVRTDFLAIFLGYVLCDFMHTDWAWRKRLCGQRALNWALLAAGLYFMCYPSAGFGYEGTLWGILPFVFVNYYHILGVLCFVFAVLNLEAAQRFLSLGVFRYLGRISYSLYLIHFLVIATFGSWFLLTFEPQFGYNLTGLLNLALISLITVALSELSVRYVEPLGGKGERFFERLVRGKRA